MKDGAVAKVRFLIILLAGFLGVACANSDKADTASSPTCRELDQMRSGLHVDRALDKIGTPLYAILNAGTNNKDPYRPTVEREAEIARLKKERGCS